MVSLMAPETLVWPLPLQTKEVRPLGTGSLTLTLVAVLTPVLVTVTVYVKLVPGTTVPILPVIDDPPLLSTLLTLTAGCGVRLSVRVALLLVDFVSLAALTVTVLESVPFAYWLTVAATV